MQNLNKIMPWYIEDHPKISVDLTNFGIKEISKKHYSNGVFDVSLM
jgi:hypothetical protein